MAAAATLGRERAARRVALIAAVHRESVRAQRKRLERLPLRRVT